MHSYLPQIKFLAQDNFFFETSKSYKVFQSFSCKMENVTPRGLQLSTRHYQNWGTYSLSSSFV